MIGPSMSTVERLSSIVASLSLFLFIGGCSNRETQKRDHPRLSTKVTMTDATFRSAALGRDMPYRVVMPSSVSAGQKLPVVYLLHGGGGGYRDWTNYSDVAKFAESGLILVMPEGGSSYYTNSAEHPEDRYEDYIVKDMISEVESRYPAAPGRENRAIVGVSMGGYGAVKIVLKHPELFAFAGGISPAVDVPTRPFSIKRLGQWRFHSSIFGPSGSQTRRDNNPYALARSVDPSGMGYLFLTCGEQEGLLPANRKLAAILAERGFAYEFRTAPGDHNWQQWDAQIPLVFESLVKHIKTGK
jgi:S-formylglutathione hydrolase FrmB